MFNIRIAGDHQSKWEMTAHLAAARDVLVGWLVGYLGLNGLLRQSLSVS